MALSDDKLWDLWNAQGTDNMSKEEAFVFARAIESEVRRLHAENADRAARAPADSVTAPAGPSKSLPYEPTSAMLIAARERDPALPIETVRAIYWSMWRTAPTPPAQAADSVPAMSDAARDLLAERARQVQ